MREKFTVWEVTETFWAPDPWNPEAPRCIAEYSVKGEGFWISGIHKKEHAQLIASAPDLLAALEAFMDTCATPKQDIQGEKNAIKHAYDLGRAALLKARGTEKDL